jgi:uncharacterized protein with HEPN domain
MPCDYNLYLQDVLEACSKIQEYISGYDFESFKSDRKTFDAVLRNLEVIGEAVKHIPEEVRGRSDKSDWRKVSALRIKLAHAYFSISSRIIWDIVQHELPPLRADVEKLLSTP